MAAHPHTLQRTAVPPLNIAASHGGSAPSSNTWFHGLTQVLNPNGISIGLTVFAGLTTVTERQIMLPDL